MGYSQAEFMRRYNEGHREHFNTQLFDRSDQDIIDAVSDVIYSCERDEYFTLKVLSITPILNYEDIYNALREQVEEKRKVGDKTDNPYDFIQINNSDIMLLDVRYLIRHNGIEKQKIDGKMVDVTNPEEILRVLIALPRFRKKYYFYLDGNYYNTTLQIVDGSTYNNSTASNTKVDSVTEKTYFQPLKVFRTFREMQDIISKQKDKNIVYVATIFNNHANCMYYILAAFGLLNGMDFLGIRNVQVSDRPILDPYWVCYQKHNLYVSFPRGCPDPMVQSLAVTIYDAIQKDTTLNDVYNQRFWLKTLGMAFKNANVEKGLFILDSIESVYDRITKRELHLPEEEKADIYCILRWLMREFPALRAKDNVDVTTKRVRIAGYIAQLYATKVSTGIHRICDMGKKVTLKYVKGAIDTAPMFLINAIIGQSNLVSYVDMVNDNDATTALKYTYKGISGLGENGAAVQPVYRYVDPTHIGILDLDVSSTSDPGMSGMICPMTKLYDGSFSQYQEPNGWKEQYGPLQDEFIHRNPNVRPAITPDSHPILPDPNANRKEIIEESLNIDKPRCPIYSLNGADPMSLTYTGYKMMEEQKKKERKSLFTIREDGAPL